LPERGPTSARPSISVEPEARKSSPRIPVAATEELAIDDLILAELTAFLADRE